MFIGVYIGRYILKMFYSSLNQKSNVVFVVKRNVTNVYYTVRKNDNTSLPMIVAFRNKNHCLSMIGMMKKQLDSKKKQQELSVVHVPLTYLNRSAPKYQLPILVLDENLNEEVINVCNDVEQVRMALEEHFTYFQ